MSDKLLVQKRNEAFIKIQAKQITTLNAKLKAADEVVEAAEDVANRRLDLHLNETFSVTRGCIRRLMKTLSKYKEGKALISSIGEER